MESGPVTIINNSLSLSGMGIVTIKATQEGKENYELAPEVTQSFCVLPAKPVSLLPVLPSLNYLATIARSYTVSVTGPCGSAITSEAFQVTVSATEPAIANQGCYYILIRLQKKLYWSYLKGYIFKRQGFSM